MRNSDVELQQRSIEYLHLSSLATADVLVSKDLAQWVRLRYLSHQRAVKGLESLCGPSLLYLTYMMFGPVCEILVPIASVSS